MDSAYQIVLVLACYACRRVNHAYLLLKCPLCFQSAWSNFIVLFLVPFGDLARCLVNHELINMPVVQIGKLLSPLTWASVVLNVCLPHYIM